MKSSDQIRKGKKKKKKKPFLIIFAHLKTWTENRPLYVCLREKDTFASSFSPEHLSIFSSSSQAILDNPHFCQYYQ